MDYLHAVEHGKLAFHWRLTRYNKIIRGPNDQLIKTQRLRKLFSCLDALSLRLSVSVSSSLYSAPYFIWIKH